MVLVSIDPDRDGTLNPAVTLPTIRESIGLIIDGMDAGEATRAQYKRELKGFAAWMDGKPLHVNTLIEWKNYLRSRVDISAGTKSKYLSSARSFLRELYRLRLIPVDVTIGIKGFKVSRSLKRQSISDEEVQKIHAFLNSSSGNIRKQTIIGLMFYQGFRRVELHRLNIEDFDKENQTLRVLGKGCDDYEFANLHPRMVQILFKYLEVKGLRSGPLFPSPRKGKRLSSNAIWRIGMRANQEIGIDRRKNLHAYRKTFTTKLIQTGMNLMEVQGYTRHKSIAMLQIYYNKLEREKTLPVYYTAFDNV